MIVQSNLLLWLMENFHVILCKTQQVIGGAIGGDYG